jgi:transcriptional regulator
MYLPKHFEESRIDILRAFIHGNPFATLVANTSQGLVANHIPMELEPGSETLGVLRGHIARANPLWKICPENAEVLTIFQGADSYITPSWYPSTRESGKTVPTWAYAVVHTYGPVRFVYDKNWLHSLVSRLTDKQEASRPVPWAVTDAPADFVGRLLDAIVGIEIPVARVEGKWKVDQHKKPADRHGVVLGLQANGDMASKQLAEFLIERGGSD